MHHYECIVLYKDISLRSGRFCAGRRECSSSKWCADGNEFRFVFDTVNCQRFSLVWFWTILWLIVHSFFTTVLWLCVVSAERDRRDSQRYCRAPGCCFATELHHGGEELLKCQCFLYKHPRTIHIQIYPVWAVSRCWWVQKKWYREGVKFSLFSWPKLCQMLNNLFCSINVSVCYIIKYLGGFWQHLFLLCLWVRVFM